ncbi:MAG: NAD(P)-dependent oxidoreductase [Phycisphaerae bacterium]
MNPIIVVTEGLEAVPLRWLKEHAQIREVKWTDGPALAAALADAEGLIVRTYTQVNADLLQQAPKLRVVGRAGVGLENIDQPACQARGVKVRSTPTANTRAVCEYVFDLLLHLGRPIVHLPAPVPAEAFHKYRKTVRGLELSGKTMAILGMGRIGRAVGKVAWALQMNVLYHDLVDVSDLLDFPAQSVEKSELLARAEVLTIHVDMRPGNHHLVNAAALAQLKKGAYVINTSRGEVLDAAALADALRTGQVAAAAIDVHDPEPPPADYPLWGLPNVIVAPHLAARTQGAMEAMSWVAKDVVEALGEK